MTRAKLAVGVVAAVAISIIATFFAVTTTFDTAVMRLKEGRYSDAVGPLEVLAVLGHQQSQFLVGEANAYGRGVPRNREDALKWFRKAAIRSQGLEDPAAYAAYYVGKSFRDGEGIDNDPREAQFWFEVAEKGGYRP
jgi:TPR repeat protein